MIHACPQCARKFEVAGFCPYDGTKLVEQVEAVSAADEAEAAIDALRTGVGGDPLIGEMLDGRYEVLRKIGHGGMGVVYAAKHAVIERPLAIKVLKRAATRDPLTVQRFVQEAKAASRIGHPNIVDVTDFGATRDGLTYSVMEYIDGPTLSKTIKEQAPLPAERAVRIAAQIARALGAAHDKGIVHRDLKPENVFLIHRDGRPDFVKIVDFGIAKVQPIEGRTGDDRKLTVEGSVFGTPEYMPPEQASGRGNTDSRVDIYALGVILYEMLCGKTPLKGTSSTHTITLQLTERIKPPSEAYPQLHVPLPLEAIVMRALEKKRDDRYQKMSEFQAALEAFAPTAPNMEPPRRQRPPTKPLHEPEFVSAPLKIEVPEDTGPVQRKPARWQLALLVVALLSAGLAVVVVVMHKSRVTDAPRDAAVVVAEHRDAAAPVVVAAQPDAAMPTDAMQIASAADAGARETHVVAAAVPRDAGARPPARAP